MANCSTTFKDQPLSLSNQQILNFTPCATDVMVPLLREQNESVAQKMILEAKRNKTLSYISYNGVM